MHIQLKTLEEKAFLQQWNKAFFEIRNYAWNGVVTKK